MGPNCLIPVQAQGNSGGFHVLLARNRLLPAQFLISRLEQIQQGVTVGSGPSSAACQDDISRQCRSYLATLVSTQSVSHQKSASLALYLAADAVLIAVPAAAIRIGICGKFHSLLQIQINRIFYLAQIDGALGRQLHRRIRS